MRREARSLPGSRRRCSPRQTESRLPAPFPWQRFPQPSSSWPRTCGVTDSSSTQLGRTWRSIIRTTCWSRVVLSGQGFSSCSVEYPSHQYGSMAPITRKEKVSGWRMFTPPLTAASVMPDRRVTKAPYSAKETSAALPMAKPFPTAAVVLPAASRASVFSRTCKQRHTKKYLNVFYGKKKKVWELTRCAVPYYSFAQNGHPTSPGSTFTDIPVGTARSMYFRLLLRDAAYSIVKHRP